MTAFTKEQRKKYKLYKLSYKKEGEEQVKFVDAVVRLWDECWLIDTGGEPMTDEEMEIEVREYDTFGPYRIEVDGEEREIYQVEYEKDIEEISNEGFIDFICDYDWDEVDELHARMDARNSGNLWYWRDYLKSMDYLKKEENESGKKYKFVKEKSKRIAEKREDEDEEYEDEEYEDYEIVFVKRYI